MALGAYSVVRFSNNVNDQRINLGVIVWHPLDGFRYRFSPFLARVQAIDPRIRIESLKWQLDSIKYDINASSPSGEGLFVHLNSIYREGLEVSSPYPARIQSVDESLDHFYELLVSPYPEIIRASSQRQFESSFQKALKIAVQQVDPKIKYKYVGEYKIRNMRVNAGIQTSSTHHKALWHPISFQSQKSGKDQIVVAKATAMDISFIRAHRNGFRGHSHMVVLQAPRPQSSAEIENSIAWLKEEADDVFHVRTIEELPSLLATKLRGRERTKR